jgi:hypothetical protein
VHTSKWSSAWSGGPAKVRIRITMGMLTCTGKNIKGLP